MTPQIVYMIPRLKELTGTLDPSWVNVGMRKSLILWRPSSMKSSLVVAIADDIGNLKEKDS